MENRINELIEILELEEHPEGGFFKETFRSSGIIEESNLPDVFTGDRNYATGIYFLLTSDTFSAFHKINQDETWHFYEGSPLTIHMINQNGEYNSQQLGLNLEKDQQPQFTVPKEVWFAAEVNKPGTYTLAGCTVSPGFDFRDFELAERNKLTRLFPGYEELIEKFTRS